MPREAIKAFLASDMTDLEVVEDFYSYVNALFCVRAIDGTDYEKFIHIAEQDEMRPKARINGE